MNISRISRIASRILFAYSKKELLDFLKYKIENDERWTIRALERIYQGQEADEVDDNETKHLNSIGFTGHDAPFLTSIYKSYKEHGDRMTPKMLAVLKKVMKKYAGQLFRADYFDMGKMEKAYENWLNQNKKNASINTRYKNDYMLASYKEKDGRYEICLLFDARCFMDYVTYDNVKKATKEINSLVAKMQRIGKVLGVERYAFRQNGNTVVVWFVADNEDNAEDFVQKALKVKSNIVVNPLI